MALSAYEQLEKRFAKLSALSGAQAMLHWDSAAMMPDGGNAARAEQLATLGVMSHELITDAAVGDWIAEAENATADLNEWQKANLKEMRTSWRHATAVDADLVEAFSRATSDSEMTWREARANKDFQALVPKLEEVVNLTRQVATIKAGIFDCSPYDALLDEYEPGCTSAQIDELFTDLEAFLPDLLNDILDHQKSQPAIIEPTGPFQEDAQKQLGLEMMTALGFDFNHGRLDTSHHPFTGGVPDDVRLTTRYEEGDFTKSLMGTLHETGHALYEQGLPEAWRTQPVGLARGMALHESQSLLVEMQLSRSSEFLAYINPKFTGTFGDLGEAGSFANIERLYRRVEQGFIRVDADEVTYPLHIILRYRLEKDLLSGALTVTDLPEAWNAGMQDLLGLTPPDDALGCLQDIHWPSGAIGYFPTYTLGALAAAQLFEAAKAQIADFPARIKDGDFAELISWLRTNVHALGSLKTTDEILEDATGAPLGTAAFASHLKARYLPD
ncbi:MAG: carboxypeptidase M32 [Proteobacteria bacterium]|nr:carboxypeptidase M32 [Pseudomonadota bacterium]